MISDSEKTNTTSENNQPKPSSSQETSLQKPSNTAASLPVPAPSIQSQQHIELIENSNKYLSCLLQNVLHNYTQEAQHTAQAIEQLLLQNHYLKELLQTAVLRQKHQDQQIVDQDQSISGLRRWVFALQADKKALKEENQTLRQELATQSRTSATKIIPRYIATPPPIIASQIRPSIPFEAVPQQKCDNQPTKKPLTTSPKEKKKPAKHFSYSN